MIGTKGRYRNELMTRDYPLLHTIALVQGCIVVLKINSGP